MRVWIILDYDDVDVSKYAFTRKADAEKFKEKYYKDTEIEADVVGPILVKDTFVRLRRPR